MFPRKTNMTKFFKKSQKPYFGPIMGPFGPLCPNLDRKWIFLEKRALTVFQYSNYLSLCQKSEKPKESFLRKLLNGHTKNQYISLIFFCEIQPCLESCDWLKNPAIWLVKSILGHIWGTRIFSNLFKHTRITDQIDKKINNWEKKLNFPIHWKYPGLGLFFP